MLFMIEGLPVTTEARNELIDAAKAIAPVISKTSCIE